MYTKQLFQVIASFRNDTENIPNLEMNNDYLDELCKFLPSGSGFDSGCKINEVSESLIRIQADFHHIDSNGFYCGWTYHVVTIKPSFHGYTLSVSGKNKNKIKDYVKDMFYTSLNTPIEKKWNGNEFTFTYGVI